MDHGLRLHDVVKRFGDKVALDGLGFAVRTGEVFGFLGGNGAGKTTTTRMILDIIRPDAGTIEVLGTAPGRETGRRLGLVQGCRAADMSPAYHDAFRLA